MKTLRMAIAACVAVSALSFSLTAQAEMVRAFWAGSITDAVNGNPYDLAVGAKLLAEMEFNTEWMESFGTFSPNDSLLVTAQFFTFSSGALVVDQPSHGTPLFSGEIRFLDGMIWQAIDSGNIIAAGTWSLESVKFEQRVIPLPATLPMLIGALGMLGALRRRNRVI